MNAELRSAGYNPMKTMTNYISFVTDFPAPNNLKNPVLPIDYANDHSVVLENSNVAQLASALYLLVHSLPQEDRYDTDDASAREIYPILVPESTMCTVQSSR